MNSVGCAVAGIVLAMTVSGAAATEGETFTEAACPDAIAAIATCQSGRDANGSYVTAAMPKKWNGDLIVFAHGGPAVQAPTAIYSKPDLARYAVEVERGYAWVASSYRRAGYGVRMAATDTEAARRMFIDQIGHPQHTFLHGVSYGGLVGAKLLEIFGRDDNGNRAYDGALLTSGLMAGSVRGYEFRVDLRAIYQYYCRNLPRPEESQYPIWMGLPPDSKLDPDSLYRLIDDCTGVGRALAERTDRQKQNLANIVGVMGIPERLLARHMQYSTFVFRDIVQMTKGRNPFTNAGVRYRGSSDDDRLNREVARFTADPGALSDLRQDGDPQGILPVPVMTLHSINDPQVVVESQADWREKVQAAGYGERLMQAFTDEPEHPSESAPEIAGALQALTQWVSTGRKPSTDVIAADCGRWQASFQGQCRFRSYEPKPFSTRFYPRVYPREATLQVSGTAVGGATN